MPDGRAVATVTIEHTTMMSSHRGVVHQRDTEVLKDWRIQAADALQVSELRGVRFDNARLQGDGSLSE